MLKHFTGAFVVTLGACLTKIDDGNSAWKQEDKMQN